VIACALTGFALSFFFFTGAHRLADLAVTLSDATLLPIVEAEMRQIDRRHGDRDDVLPALADELALLDVLAQVLFDLPTHDVLEPHMVLLDAQRHGRHRRKRGRYVSVRCVR